MASMIYKNRIADDLTTIHVADVNKQLAQKADGRSLFYLQWALAQAGTYTDDVDGRYRPSVQTALDAARGQGYDDPAGTYRPLTGPSVSLAFLAAFFHDYLDTPVDKIVAA